MTYDAQGSTINDAAEREGAEMVARVASARQALAGVEHDAWAVAAEHAAYALLAAARGERAYAGTPTVAPTYDAAVSALRDLMRGMFLI